MYKGYNLKLNSNKIFDGYNSEGKKLYDDYRLQIRNSLANNPKEMLELYTNSDGSLDGQRIQEDWFPKVNADIFISHSHMDSSLAINLSGWLYKEFKLKAFIDSCVWKYFFDLQNELDDRYCKIKEDENGKLYNYSEVLYSSSHVHMMLAAALQHMIDYTECVFFLNTPNSIEISDTINQTTSPWIFMEVTTAQIIEKKNPIRKGIAMDQYFSMNERENLVIKEPVDLSNFFPLSQSDLESWIRNFKYQTFHSLTHPLDYLYKLTSRK